MVVAVDGRSLRAAHERGVSAYTRGMLTALARLRPGDELRVALAPGAALPDLPNVRAARPARPDVAWLPAPAPVVLPPRVPVVLSLHDLSWEERPADFTRYERAWHRVARPAALARRAARIAAVSEATARAAASRWGVRRIAVVPAGPGDPGPEASPEAVAATRERHGRYLLFVGALEPRKGLPTLLAAHACARAQGLDAGLVVAGEGRLRAAVRGPGVTALGRVDGAHKAALYAGALAVVLPSWLEGYGYPPLEGYAHGVPAVVTDVGGLAETAGPGALVVPAGDVDALAAALLRIAGDEDLRGRLATAGAATLRARAWTACAERLWEQFEDAAA